MFHPENHAIMKALALKNLQRPVQSPDAALAIGAAEMLEPQVLAFAMNGKMVSDVKSESVFDIPIERGLVNDFSGAAISPEAHDTAGEHEPLYLGDLVGGV